MAFPTFIKDENDIDFGQECPVFPSNCRYKVSSVTINGRSITALLTEDEELLCFPQLVDYFLKDHVAGMPTIYAKVKRMGIVARSCNLDQVRLMRSMGAIGPVVNRCKLITMEDFKRLYEDCLLFRYVKLVSLFAFSISRMTSLLKGDRASFISFVLSSLIINIIMILDILNNMLESSQVFFLFHFHFMFFCTLTATPYQKLTQESIMFSCLFLMFYSRMEKQNTFTLP